MGLRRRSPNLCRKHGTEEERAASITGSGRSSKSTRDCKRKQDGIHRMRRSAVRGDPWRKSQCHFATCGARSARGSSRSPSPRKIKSKRKLHSQRHRSRLFILDSECTALSHWQVHKEQQSSSSTHTAQTRIHCYVLTETGTTHLKPESIITF